MSFNNKKINYDQYLKYWFAIQNSNNLTSSEKLILQKIKLFIEENDKPFENSNQFLGLMIKIHEKSISRSIRSLFIRGYLKILYDGKKREIICTDKIE